MKVLFLILIILSNFSHTPKSANEQLVGVWQCYSYDIRVNVFLENNEINARLLSFPCSHKVKMPLKDHKDIHNPDRSLRERSLLNIFILSGLKYETDNKWSNGSVYLPMTGQSLKATIIKISDHQVEIRGFLGFEFIGKSLTFNRVY